MGLVEHDAEVLAHPLHSEAELELAPRHGVRTVLHLPRLRRALRDDSDELFHVQSGTLREVDPFGEPLHDADDADLVDHLGELTRPRRPQQFARTCIGHDHRPGLLEHAGIAAAHHRERAVHGSGLSA